MEDSSWLNDLEDYLMCNAKGTKLYGVHGRLIEVIEIFFEMNKVSVRVGRERKVNNLV